MKLEIEIPDEKVKCLSPTANMELARVAKSYIIDVLDEAGRIEESRRNSKSSPEITGAIINEAVLYSKTIGFRKKKSAGKIFLQIVSYVSTIFTGALFNIDKFKNVGYVLLFLAVFTVCMFSTIYVITNSSKND